MWQQRSNFLKPREVNKIHLCGSFSRQAKTKVYGSSGAESSGEAVHWRVLHFQITTTFYFGLLLQNFIAHPDTKWLLLFQKGCYACPTMVGGISLCTRILFQPDSYHSFVKTEPRECFLGRLGRAHQLHHTIVSNIIGSWNLMHCLAEQLVAHFKP